MPAEHKMRLVTIGQSVTATIPLLLPIVQSDCKHIRKLCTSVINDDCNDVIGKLAGGSSIKSLRDSG